VHDCGAVSIEEHDLDLGLNARDFGSIGIGHAED
jgi:hypothetical protein